MRNSELVKSIGYYFKRMIKISLNAVSVNLSDKKSFTGSIFDRFQGIDFLFPYCKNASILDLGACDGLVSYELARNGANIIHGFERDIDDVFFARRLFRDVPIETIFNEANFAVPPEVFFNRHKLNKKYDIVLFLGVYHHLKKDMDILELELLLKRLLEMTKTWFAIRTDLITECESIILSNNFKVAYDAPKIKEVGKLKIFKRN